MVEAQSGLTRFDGDTGFARDRSYDEILVTEKLNAGVETSAWVFGVPSVRGIPPRLVTPKGFF